MPTALEMKCCTRCKLEKPLAAYGKHPKGKNGISPRCRQCKNEVTRLAHRKNPAPSKAAASRYRFKAYGITPEQYQEMLSAQGGACAICQTTKPSAHGRFHVDHCHSTQRVRGLLCHGCNTGLGLFKDMPELLQKAAEYLRKVGPL